MVNVNFNEMSYDELQTHVKQAIDALTLKAYSRGNLDANLANVGRVKSTQEIRDDIVRRAKKFIYKYDNDDFQYTFRYNNHSGKDILGGTRAKVEYVVNKEKRVVVALIKSYYGGKLLSKGKAKCDPADCFNVHIGKAIALRRALGIEVLVEYLNAPQPTEVRVGDVVCGNGYTEFYSVDKTFTLTSRNGECDGFNYAESEEDWIEYEQIGRIIDDSREQA
jgi:hypothetical protein